MVPINLWSSPRNISTALMYSFAQRPDTQVFDEPLYAHYLSKTSTEAKHPATRAILESQNSDGEAVINQLILALHDKPVALFKQMTHHLIDLDWSFMQNTKNVLLIRNPRAIIASFVKVIPNPTIDDVGIAKQWKLYEYLKQHNCLDAIIDTTDILKNPEAMLKSLCKALDIPFYPEMLHWQAGPRPEDGVWAPYWYTSVHQSTGFTPYQDRTYTLSEQHEKLAEKCMVYYNRFKGIRV